VFLRAYRKLPAVLILVRSKASWEPCCACCQAVLLDPSKPPNRYRLTIATKRW